MEEEIEELKRQIEEYERICDIKDSEIRRLRNVIRSMREEEQHGTENMG